MITDKDPPSITVSVRLMTYNHERFIADALSGILMQKTDFEYEIVVGDDCSTDATLHLVREFQGANPGKIRILPRETQLGRLRNFIDILANCRGKYVALLDGDDYWTDPLKLQKQVDFLEAHSECVICFHKIVAFHEDGNRERYYNPPHDFREISTLDDLLIKNFIQTCSVVFRNGLIQELPDWFYTLRMGDWPLFVLLAQHGKIGFMDELMAAYRIHTGGIWSEASAIDHWHALIFACGAIANHLGTDYARLMAASMSRLYLRLSRAYSDKGDLVNSRVYLRKSISTYPLNPHVRLIDVLALFCQLHIPRAYKILKYIVN